MRRPKKGKDGLYHTQKYIGKFADGSRYYERFEGEVWADVLAEAEQFKRDWNAGLNPQKEKKRNRQRTKHAAVPQAAPMPAAPVLTLGEAMDRYIETTEVTGASPATIAGYSAIRRNSFPSLIDKPLNALTLDDIQSALNERAKNRTPKTVRNDLGLLRSVLALYRPDLDLRSIRVARNPKRKKLIMSNASAQDILREAKAYRPDFYIYILIGLFAGMRPSETYALTWADVSAKPHLSIAGGQRIHYGEIHVSKACVRDKNGVYQSKGTKTEAGTRVITVDWSFFKELYAVKPRGKEDERVVSITPLQCDKDWRKLRAALGLPDGLRYYDLRHYYASSMIAAGAPEDYVAAAMGHSSSTLTHQIYVELIGEKQSQINADMAHHTSRLLNGEKVEYTKSTAT